MELCKTGLPLGLGTSKLRSLNGGVSASAARHLLEAAFELGIRFVDTAASYGQGDAENAIGTLPARLRDELIVCSKVGYPLGGKAALVRALKPVLRPAVAAVGSLCRTVGARQDGVHRAGASGNDIQPQSLRAGVHDSLRRLRRQRLDILLLHDPSRASLADANQQTLDALVREGLVGQWGVCTRDMAIARASLALDNLSVIQVPVDRESVAQAEDLFDQCEKRQVAVIANRVLSPLAGPALEVLDVENLIARCFEFALKQPGVSIVLCGTTKLAHLANNVRGMQRAIQTADVAR